LATTVVSGGALGNRTVTVTSSTGFSNGNAVYLVGGGNAGGTAPLETFLTATPASNVLTFREKVLATAGLTAGAAVQGYLKLNTPFRPRRIKLVNTTDGVTWDWWDGMSPRSAVKTVWSTGVTTLQSGDAPYVVADGILMPQSVLGLSKTFAFDVEA
jgi:hypothetical protein